MATIVKLPETTIQLIAAGEVITKPYSVIKELLENSLDAGATNVRLAIEQGGVKLIEIIDNGHGIARNNSDLLCQRHATSKLKSADDLTRISTFGFRGEALASISEMADVEVKTFNKNVDKCGWHAKYNCGVIVDGPIDKKTQNPGTHIRVTNLFKDTIQRKKAMQSSFLDGKKHIIELVQRYAIHHREKVTITLKESNQNDLICVLAPMPLKSCIGLFFGVEMENNLIEINIENSTNFKAEVNMALAYKKSTSNSNNFNFILFVNNRLVVNNDLRREIEAQFNENLSLKQHSALAYVSLQVPPSDVDVNTHPAKATVALNFRAEITTFIIDAMKDRLKEVLTEQPIGPSSIQTKLLTQLVISSQKSQTTNSSSQESQQRIKLLAPACLNQTVQATSSTPAKRQYDLVHNDSTQPTLQQLTTTDCRTKRDLKLKSIHDLKMQVAKEKAKDCVKIIKNSSFVGIFDHKSALIQHETKLYAINLKAFLKEQYYQFYLFDFANFPPIEILPPGNKIRPMIDTYLDHIKRYENEVFQNLKFQTTDSIVNELVKRSEMFEDYLSLKITSDEILTIPAIMPNEIPNLTYLCKLFVDLANQVDYTSERVCLHTIGRVLADFYSESPSNLKDYNVHRHYHELVDSKLYKAIKQYLLIPEWLFLKENICQVSDTKDLYKVFERC